MGDITTVSMKPKEGGSFSISCPMLNATNYTVWEIRIKILLKVRKVWEVIEHDSDDNDKNNMATALLFQSIPETMILQVGELDKAKQVWEAIKLRHAGEDMGADRMDGQSGGIPIMMLEKSLL